MPNGIYLPDRAVTRDIFVSCRMGTGTLRMCSNYVLYSQERANCGHPVFQHTSILGFGLSCDRYTIQQEALKLN